MKISALSSGSNGNCFYISNKKNNSSILIDAGISCRKIVGNLNFIGENPKKIKGIFVTHEHSDHIKGLDVLARKYQIPIFATKKTIKNSFLCSQKHLINEIKNNETIKIKGLEIEAFSKSHDAADPVSFAINNGKKISIITDIGHTCQNVRDFVHDSDFLVIETNHDLSMLENGPYPYFLKQRINSNIGHLSNFHAGLCVMEYGKSKLKNVMLAHLSKTNNTSQIALNTFKSLIKERYDLDPRILVSEKQIPTNLISV